MPVIRRCAKAATSVDGERYHALEEPTSLNTLGTVAGIDGRQYRLGENRRPSAQPGLRDPVAKVWRRAIDRCKADPQNFVPQSALGWRPSGAMSEGTQTTLGAYHRKWQ